MKDGQPEYILPTGILFLALGWLLRGQGSFYKDYYEFWFGTALAALGFLIVGWYGLNEIRKRNKDE